MNVQEALRTFTDTFSSESGVSIAKAMRMTCDFEYDSGRKRYTTDGANAPHLSIPATNETLNMISAHLVLFLSAVDAR